MFIFSFPFPFPDCFRCVHLQTKSFATTSLVNGPHSGSACSDSAAKRKLISMLAVLRETQEASHTFLILSVHSSSSSRLYKSAICKAFCLIRRIHMSLRAVALKCHLPWCSRQNIWPTYQTPSTAYLSRSCVPSVRSLSQLRQSLPASLLSYMSKVSYFQNHFIFIVTFAEQFVHGVFVMQ